MPATALRSRALFANAGLLSLLALIGRPAGAQQLGSAFKFADEQTAVVRIQPGEFVRVRLKDGSRAGGPLISATPTAFTVGPSVAYGDRDSVLALGAMDSLWVRVPSTRRGALSGAVLGGLVGLGIGLTSTSLCPTEGPGEAKPCASGVITTTASGVLLGGIMGSLVGSGRTHWRRHLPRGDMPSGSGGAEATLIARPDSTTYDPRALALMRIPSDAQVRLTFKDRGDLAGYLLRTGAGGATLEVRIGTPGDVPIPLESLESIWERGTARRTGTTAGVVLGSATGIAIATGSSSCDPDNSCTSAILLYAGTGALLGYLFGGIIGDHFPKWHRRY